MMRYKIIHESRLVIILNEGETSVAECVSLFNHFAKNAPEAFAYNSVTDVRRLTNFITFDEADQVVQIMKSSDSKLPRHNALLVGDKAQYGVGRMFQQISQGEIPVISKVVDSMADAAQWVACAEEVLERELLSGGFIDVSPK